ncbi:hypothetical protein HOA55_03415 [archaeon]|jgi:hypothetical protein|nr:hypothetical protein [archaeon]MBT3577379.1 hypothetical protein [archaeon]MBT6820378.1 hypothetical protein [archaeon]MBT6956147.1 hypothetical protein [archaeon]MBT7025192.1 hypothetical protein [archaeon]
MSRVLIFNRLEDFALNPSNKGVVLFGEKKFFSDKERTYDVVFHAWKNVQNPYALKKPCSLVIPVIKGDWHDVELLRLNDANPDYTRFAVPAGDRILFYDIKKGAFGRGPDCAEGYTRVMETPFHLEVGLPKMKREIEKTRRDIDGRCQDAFLSQTE